MGVALYLAAGRVGSVAVIADDLKGVPVQQGQIIKMQDKHRRIGRGLVDFLKGGQAALGELKLGPALPPPAPIGAAVFSVPAFSTS